MKCEEFLLSIFWRRRVVIACIPYIISSLRLNVHTIYVLCECLRKWTESSPLYKRIITWNCSCRLGLDIKYQDATDIGTNKNLYLCEWQPDTGTMKTGCYQWSRVLLWQIRSILSHYTGLNYYRGNVIIWIYSLVEWFDFTSNLYSKLFWNWSACDPNLASFSCD